MVFLCFPGSSGKESACNAGDLGSIPCLGGSPGEGNSYPFQYSGLENSMDCMVQGVTNSRTWLSDFHCASQVALEVKNLSAKAGDTGSIPGWGSSPRGGNSNPLQYSCWRIPWTEQPGGLQSLGSQRVRQNWSDLAHASNSLVFKVEMSLTSENCLQWETQHSSKNHTFVQL